MALRRLVPVLIVILQLYKVIEGTAFLPVLQGNKLLIEEPVKFRVAPIVNCGTFQSRPDVGTTARTVHLNDALKPQAFALYGFTAGPLSSVYSPATGNITQFKFAEVKTYKMMGLFEKSRMYALQVDPSGDSAYWLPQGKSIDVPTRPNGNQPKYVFTPDFSGCSWTVTPLGHGYLRLRHVEGSQEVSQFNNLSPADKGGPITYAMQPTDYGYLRIAPSSLVKTIRSFAYMHFSGGVWKLYLQRQACLPTPGGYRFANKQLKSMNMFDFSTKTPYNHIESTEEYRIPQ